MKKFVETIFKYIFLLCACLSVLAVVSICVFIFKNGIPAINEIGLKSFVLGKEWKPMQGTFGIFPMIISSIYVTTGAVAIGGPIGVLTAVFLAYYCPKGLYKVIKPMINLLASVPSIIYGFFFLVAVVPVMQKLTGTGGKGMLTAAILLGLMILPTIINTAEASINAVPIQYYEGALALGATKEHSIFKIVLPAASSGVLSGIILGIGRAIGETMAVIMVIGNQPVLPKSVISGVRTLTGNIVIEMAYASGLHRGALIGTAVVLFVLIMIINLCFSAITRKKA
ncbi:MAG: phosphate ABC transporter permease subunit PstC [Eubacterium sp.]